MYVILKFIDFGEKGALPPIKGNSGIVDLNDSV